MRKITRDAFEAFVTGRRFRKTGNGATEVRINEDGTRYLLLHGNRIAEYGPADRGVYISTAGWSSVTTRERLRPFAAVSQRRGDQHLSIRLPSGEWRTTPWDGDWFFVGVVDGQGGFTPVSEIDLTPRERAAAYAARIKANLEEQGDNPDPVLHRAYADALNDCADAA